MKFLFILVSLITFASIGRSNATIFSRFNKEELEDKFTEEQLKYLDTVVSNKFFKGKLYNTQGQKCKFSDKQIEFVNKQFMDAKKQFTLETILNVFLKEIKDELKKQFIENLVQQSTQKDGIAANDLKQNFYFIMDTKDKFNVYFFDDDFSTKKISCPKSTIKVQIWRPTENEDSFEYRLSCGGTLKKKR
jgi:hypothetical protein